MTLMIEAKGSAGQSLRDDIIPDMVRLAQRTQCSVEVNANDTIFWAYPRDTIEEMQAAYDRLYPESRYVSTGMATAASRKTVARPSESG